MTASPDDQKLTLQEEAFALCVVDLGGNVGDAYKVVFGKDEPSPSAKGRELLSKPAILKRVADLHVTANDTTLISISSHLIELAAIRDLSKALNQPKAALDAERSRGEVAGFYNKTLKQEDPTEQRLNAVRATLRAAMAATEQD